MTVVPSAEILRFRKIPHQTDLFLDYLERAPRAMRFYDAHPVFPDLRSVAARIVRSHAASREEMAEILLEANRSYGCTPETESSIRTLAQPDSVAVVTGQQVGLFLGPLYTTYKTLTAIRLAAALQERGIKAVPVFWMDSEDHDLAEVTRGFLYDQDRTPRIVDYRPMLFDGEPSEEASCSVGGMRLPEAIGQVVEETLESLRSAPREPEVRTALHDAYRPGASLAEGFGSLMSRLFGSRGLILFDSQNREAKPLVAEVFRRAIECADLIHEVLLRRNQDLQENGYHTQVHVLENSTTLFLLDQSERRALIRSGAEFSLKNSSRRFSADELLELARAEPERFSPNVLLRPLIQDTLFPTAAYVAGPAEIAYFAQIHALYPLFERTMPVIWPRSSLTLLEPEVGELLSRNGIGLEDCFEGKHHVVEKLIAASSDSSAASLIQGLSKEIQSAVEGIRPDLAEVDASLGPALDMIQRKMLHQVDVLGTRFVHLEAKRNSRVLEEADLILNLCYPNKNLQERELFLHQLWARYGASLLSRIYELIDNDSFEHKIVRLARE
jgi:bacillithiol biosynthesis cysteine-adding enzyme BshC